MEIKTYEEIMSMEKQERFSYLLKNGLNPVEISEFDKVSPQAIRKRRMLRKNKFYTNLKFQSEEIKKEIVPKRFQKI